MTTSLDKNDFLTALRRDGDAFAAAAGAVGFTAPVVSCPAWSVADLLWHLTEVHHFWGSVVAQQAGHWNEVVELERVPDEQLMATYEAGLTRLVDALGASDPATPVWTWSTDHTAGFVIRRMAQETAVHRWDAELVAGTPTAIEAALASDGIDEFLFHFLTNAAQRDKPVDGSVHIHCGDVAGEWTIRPTEGGFDISREHAKGDCALRGGASDLLLTLWRRCPLDSIDVVGNADIAAQFVATTRLE